MKETVSNTSRGWMNMVQLKEADESFLVTVKDHFGKMQLRAIEYNLMGLFKVKPQYKRVYKFQVYRIIIQHLCTLHGDHHHKFKYHQSPYT